MPLHYIFYLYFIFTFYDTGKHPKFTIFLISKSHDCVACLKI